MGVTLGLTVAVNLDPRALLRAGAAACAAANKAPWTPIAEVVDGATVKVAGRVGLADEVLVAPFSERRCCCYSAELRRSMVTNHAPYVETMGRDEEARAFLLDDGEGKALVKVGPATRTVAMQRKVGGSHGDWDAWEWALTDGDVVAVFGPARWELDHDSGCMQRLSYRDAPRVLVVDASVILDAFL